MKKALIITNTASMVHMFNSMNIEILQEAGYEVHIACNFVLGNTASKKVIEEYKEEWKQKGVISHHINVLRTPFSFKSLQTYKETKKLIREGKFDIIHCHTPIISVFARLAARKLRKSGTKVIYTVHGFFFYNGCPKFNWMTYYPVEIFLGKFTDILIAINREDYLRALRRIPAKKIAHLNGIGVDTQAIKNTPCDREGVRKEIGIPNDSLIIMSVGELNHNKNHRVIIEALAMCEEKNIHYVIAGIGYAKEELEKLSEELGIADRVHLLGFRKDIFRLLRASDIFAFPSHKEGLPVSVMEAMSAGLPVIASRIRGNVDLIEDEEGGLLYKCDDAHGMAEGIKILVSMPEVAKKMGEINQDKILHYDCSVIAERMKDIYLGTPIGDGRELHYETLVAEIE